MKRFDPYNYSVGNYQRVVGKEFIGKRTSDFKYYEPDIDQNAYKPLPLNCPVKEHLSVQTCSVRPAKGIIYYKAGYDFLSSPATWTLLKTDRSLLPKTATFQCGGNLFIQRIYCWNNLIGPGEESEPVLESDLHFLKLKELYQRKFDRIKFEEVVGVFIEEESDEHLLFHTCSDGVTLDYLCRHSPKEIKEGTQNLLAQAMGELHKSRIHFTDPLPTNMRYDLGNRIILNPHNCMEFKKVIDLGKFGGPDSPILGIDDVATDLALVIYTNDWITSIDRFLDPYTIRKNEDSSFRKHLSKNIRGIIKDLLETGDYADLSPVPHMWLKRGKLNYYDL